MSVRTREIKSFFYSQYFSDGLRMMSGILLPSLVLSQLNHFDIGLTMSLGAVCICTIDSPGPVAHKRNGMAIGNLCLFLVSIITGFARLNVFTLGLEITLLSFLFSMFTVYGNRAASVGTSALLVMIFMMDREAKPSEVLTLSLTILSGGVWYLLFSMIFFGIRPYRASQQALGENIADIAAFVRIKADFYLPHTDIDENYRKLVSQQIKVSQNQDGVRELLFKTRLVVKESTGASRMLVLTFVDLVDMYEQIMATHYDYAHLRDRFSTTGILTEIAGVLKSMADELDHIAYMVLSHSGGRHKPDFTPALEKLKMTIDKIGSGEENVSTLALKKILINLRELNNRIISIYNYCIPAIGEAPAGKASPIEYSKFVTHQDYAPHFFFDNLTFSSAAFKHSIRVGLLCLIGFITAKYIALGHHSYWVLLTIIVILKPGYSLSKQRNYQRLTGTIAGGVIGIAILLYIPDTTIQFILLVVLMLGTYSFLRLNYVVSVIFMTPYVLILFKFLGVGFVVKERIIDTVIGSSIAFIASYLIFPTWEFEQIRENLRDVINANVTYLVKIAECIWGQDISITDYKLARKEVFVKSANLSAAFERMTSEPKSKQRKIRKVHKFVVLNHILSSYIATIASGLSVKNLSQRSDENLKLLKRSIAVLNDLNKKLNGETIELKIPKTFLPGDTNRQRQLSADDRLLNEQLGFINKISSDIARVTENILN